MGVISAKGDLLVPGTGSRMRASELHARHSDLPCETVQFQLLEFFVGSHEPQFDEVNY